MTVDVESNYLVGDNTEAAKEVCLDILNSKMKKGKIPELWDGKSAERIVSILLERISESKIG